MTAGRRMSAYSAAAQEGAPAPVVNARFRISEPERRHEPSPVSIATDLSAKAVGPAGQRALLGCAITSSIRQSGCFSRPRSSGWPPPGSGPPPQDVLVWRRPLGVPPGRPPERVGTGVDGLEGIHVQAEQMGKHPGADGARAQLHRLPWPRTAIRRRAEALRARGSDCRRTSGRRCSPTPRPRCGGPPHCGSADGTHTSPSRSCAIRSPPPRRCAMGSCTAPTPNAASPGGRTWPVSPGTRRCPRTSWNGSPSTPTGPYGSRSPSGPNSMRRGARRSTSRWAPSPRWTWRGYGTGSPSPRCCDGPRPPPTRCSGARPPGARTCRPSS